MLSFSLFGAGLCSSALGVFLIASSQTLMWDWMSTKSQNLCYPYSVLPLAVSYKFWRDLQGPFSQGVALSWWWLVCLAILFRLLLWNTDLTRNARHCSKTGWAQILCQGFLRSLWLTKVGRMLDACRSLMHVWWAAERVFLAAPVWTNFGYRCWVCIRRHIKVMVLSLATPGLAISNETANFCMVFQWL